MPTPVPKAYFSYSDFRNILTLCHQHQLRDGWDSVSLFHSQFWSCDCQQRREKWEGLTKIYSSIFILHQNQKSKDTCCTKFFSMKNFHLWKGRIVPIIQARPKHLLALQSNLVEPLQSTRGAPTDTSEQPVPQPQQLPQQFHYMPTLLSVNKERTKFCLMQSQNVNNILQKSRMQYIHVKRK